MPTLKASRNFWTFLPVKSAREVPAFRLFPEKCEEDISSVSTCNVKDRVVVCSASTPQVWGSINGLGKIDSAFHPRYIGSINEYQACLES
ncbi:hypothetical protein TNCV_1793761 [Trichonephila clavipes]|nr:hypothetical protein TNCV_1793761 [Trichonephila clavipes]